MCVDWKGKKKNLYSKLEKVLLVRRLEPGYEESRERMIELERYRVEMEFEYGIKKESLKQFDKEEQR